MGGGKAQQFSDRFLVDLSFPPIFFELLLSLAIFWLVRRMLVPTGIYDFVWHPALFNTA
ncbi:p-hydroxybenzoic acid efflux pump operon protein AaeX, partial [Salmonella enterica subsp. enterica serovar Anatum]|nr:p-hydroxybenzoic acid efflux pump operon protein AaeX [Salmonella enterica subsp. enterica serovar Anatum]